MNAEGHRKYTAGFLFKGDRRSPQVLLVQKTHPKWQNGLLNAVGGEFEPGEEGFACMVREFYEEAKYHASWEFFCSEYGPGYEVHFYRAWLPNGSEYKPPKYNDKGEPLTWSSTTFKHAVVGNLNWLIPLALDPRPIECIVRTAGDIRTIASW